MKLILSVNDERKCIARIFYGYLLFIFLVEYLNQRMIHDMVQPVIINPSSDNFYWLLHLLFIPQSIAGSEAACFAFETLLITIAVICFFFPRGNLSCVLFTVLFAVYIVTKNSFVAHHEHGLNVPFIMSFIFWSKNTDRFMRLFKAFRYYVLFVFVSATLWKILRGSIFLPEQFSEILKTQHLKHLLFHPDSTFSRVIIWLIENPQVGWWLLISVTLLQFVFVAGFFTYRFDLALLTFFFLFFIGDYLFMGLSFYQWYVAVMVFLPWKGFRLEQGQRKFISFKYKNTAT